jgi:hypothetical protein
MWAMLASADALHGVGRFLPRMVQQLFGSNCLNAINCQLTRVFVFRSGSVVPEML